MRLTDGLREWFRLTPGKKALRLVALLCLAGFLVILAGHGFGTAVVAVPLLLFGVLSVLSADSEAPLIALGGSALAWAFTQRAAEISSPLTPLAALLLLAYHCLLTVTAHGPAGAQVPAATLRRWGVRSAVVAALTLVSWALLMGLRQSPLHAPAWAGGIALALLGGVLFALARSLRAGGEE